MDIAHHALIGGAGCMVGFAIDQPLAGAGFAVGSVIPDLDVFFMVFGKRAFLTNHQGITHSLLMAPLIAILVSLVLLLPLGMGWDWAVFGGVLAGIWIHAGLDWCNTFGIGLFMPVSSKRYNLDAVFFIDGVALGLTGLFYLLYGYFRIEAAALAYPAAFLAYLVLKMLLHRTVLHGIRPRFAIPSSFNPFEFYILAEEGEGLTGYLYNVMTRTTRKQETYSPVAREYEKMAERSQVYRDMRSVTRDLRITRVVTSDRGVELHAADLAVRNFGGHFARTVLTFDREGNVVNEVANI